MQRQVREKCSIMEQNLNREVDKKYFMYFEDQTLIHMKLDEEIPFSFSFKEFVQYFYRSFIEQTIFEEYNAKI